jgi:HEAT repeat protein
MKRLAPIVVAQWVCALACTVGATPLRAELPSLREMITAGQFREAYETSQRNAGNDRQDATAQLARELLRASMADQDVYARWFALRAIQPLREPELVAAARKLARSNDRYEQSLALEFLAHADPEGSRDYLITGLDSPFRSIRVRSLQGLMGVKDPQLGRRYETLLANDADPDVRALAVRALATTGASEFIPPLEQALDDPAVLVQEEAVAALVTLGDPRLVEVLRQRLTDATGPARVRVIQLCGRVPAPELVADLGPLLADGDPEIRTNAAGAILAILEQQRDRKQ